MSSAQITAVSPALSLPRVTGGREEGMAQSGGEGNAFGSLVIEQRLHQIKKVVMVSPMRHQVLLKK